MAREYTRSDRLEGNSCIGGENCERARQIVYAEDESGEIQAACNNRKRLLWHLSGCSYLYAAHIYSFFKDNIRKMIKGGLNEDPD